MFGTSGLPPGIDAKEMENMWKYLDDLSQNNPDEYKKFISSQMEEMKHEIKKDKEKEE